MTRTEPRVTPQWQRAADAPADGFGARDVRWSTLGIVAFLGILTAGGFLTRLWLLGDKSLWLDEAFSWRMAHLSFTDIASRARHEDVHPPGLYALLHVWVNVFGDSETSLRMPSALAAGGSFLLVAVAGRRIGGAILAVLAVVLLAVNPTSLQYTQDARFYAIMSFLVLATAMTQAWFVSRPSFAPIAFYTVSAILMFYTHNSGLVVVGVQGLVFGWYGFRQWSQGGGRSILAGGFVAGIAMLVAYAPWIPAIYEQVEGGGAYVPEPSIRLAGATLRGVLGLRHTGTWWAVFAVPLVATTMFGLYRRRENELVVCIAAVAAVPVALFVLSYLVSPAFDTKRVSSFIPAISLLGALGLAELLEIVRRLEPRSRLAVPIAMAAIAILAGIMSGGMRDWYDAPPYEDWRAAAAELEASPGPIYHFPAYLDDPLAYYLGGAAESRLRPVEYDREGAPAGFSGIDPAPSGPGRLVISHVTQDEQAGLLDELSVQYKISEPLEYTDSIWIYALTPANPAEVAIP